MYLRQVIGVHERSCTEEIEGKVTFQFNNFYRKITLLPVMTVGKTESYFRQIQINSTLPHQYLKCNKLKLIYNRDLLNIKHCKSQKLEL